MALLASLNDRPSLIRTVVRTVDNLSLFLRYLTYMRVSGSLIGLTECAVRHLLHSIIHDISVPTLLSLQPLPRPGYSPIH